MKNKNENTGPEYIGPENETPAAVAAWLLAIAAQNLEPVDILPAESVRPVDETSKRIAAKLPAGRVGPVYCFNTEREAKETAMDAARAADQRRRFVPAWGSVLNGRYWFACLASVDAVPVTLETATVAELAAEIHRRQAVALVIEPDDLAAYWQCDESGSTSPATEVPDGETWAMCRRAFERWQDSGAFTECLERMRDAWNECNRRRNGKQNNAGRIVKTVAGESGRTFLEVWDTNETGRPVDLVVSCCVESGETEREAVEGLLNEFKHPFGAAWESPEQYGKEFDAVLWLAEFYGIETEQNGKGESK